VRVGYDKALARLTGRQLRFSFCSGGAFDLSPTAEGPVRLAVQCGGCMLTRREVLRRIDEARAAGVPVVNYGMVLAKAAGLDVSRIAGVRTPQTARSGSIPTSASCPAPTAFSSAMRLTAGM
jgi:hypothetical protein